MKKRIGVCIINCVTVVLMLIGCGNMTPGEKSGGASGETSMPDTIEAQGGGTGASSENAVQGEISSPGGTAAEYRKISAEEAKQLLDGEGPTILLDVRTEEEYLEKRIDGALLIPHTEIDARAQDELPDKELAILVYCRTGIRSAAACKALARMGYANVYDIGGVPNWPYETVSGKP